ncbi:MAG: YihY/virulence factor BrkB family protein [Solirubrobacterales bacterium]|nr:YihY/virulence factor BrkB family protein [Solirubrobacterales bacterium]
MRRAARWVYSFWWGDGLADDVPALTYYLVLSVAPFALGLAAVEAFLLKDFVSAVEVADQVNRYLPEEVHGDVRELITGARTSSPYLLLIAVVAMLWTTSGAIGVVERVVSRVLGGARHNIVFGRLRNMALGALVGALVIGAAGSATVVTGLTDVLGVGSALPGEMILLLNTVGAIVLLAVIYRTAPLQHLHWSSALLGALPAGLAIQAIPNLVGVYVANAGSFAAVRLFLVLAAVLIGLYSMATTMVIGAGLAARRERAYNARQAEKTAVAVARPRTSPGEQAA